MNYHLAIGDRMYSSWSLRGWLLFAAFDLPFKTELLEMYTPGFKEGLKPYGRARLVPAVRIEPEDGSDPRILWDTLAIAETLHEDFPDTGIWPSDPNARALARTLAAEMHSGFGPLREHCQMNLRSGFGEFESPKAVLDDIARLEDIWAYARGMFGASGPWLFGEYCAADAFFAPVAARIAAYGLDVSDAAAAYVDAHLNHRAFRQWRAMAFAANRVIDVYDTGLPERPWPGPAPLPAKPVTDGEAINATCPYSGKPIGTDSLAEIDGRIVGFCNPFCRDKSVADPQAWPKLMALLAG